MPETGGLLNSWINAAEFARSKGQGLAMALEDKARLVALEKQVANLLEENEILKKSHGVLREGSSPFEKYGWIQGVRGPHKVSRMCKVLGVSR